MFTDIVYVCEILLLTYPTQYPRCLKTFMHNPHIILKRKWHATANKIVTTLKHIYLRYQVNMSTFHNFGDKQVYLEI